MNALHSELFSVQTPLGAWPEFGTQSCSEAPSDIWVEVSKMQWWTSG